MVTHDPILQVECDIYQYISCIIMLINWYVNNVCDKLTIDSMIFRFIFHMYWSNNMDLLILILIELR